MERYERGNHTVWDCKYPLLWITKYRYEVLGGDVGVRCRKLLRVTFRGHDMVIHAGSINCDHFHMPMSTPPSLSGSRVVRHRKGRNSHKRLAEFAALRKLLGSASPRTRLLGGVERQRNG